MLAHISAKKSNAKERSETSKRLPVKRTIAIKFSDENFTELHRLLAPEPSQGSRTHRSDHYQPARKFREAIAPPILEERFHSRHAAHNSSRTQ
ncbi:hypothetical protein [Achromobacter xylosoxidans]|uniref:hypothetical protein n=1 Tax=Alcaligenes xylosoxydans xylosoxydans TaxID=85698 RepID=UPI0012F4EF51|nr:hypothetical protein [Achromobacter xylosoxidans]